MNSFNHQSFNPYASPKGDEKPSDQESDKTKVAATKPLRWVLLLVPPPVACWLVYLSAFYLRPFFDLVGPHFQYAFLIQILALGNFQFPYPPGSRGLSSTRCLAVTKHLNSF